MSDDGKWLEQRKLYADKTEACRTPEDLSKFIEWIHGQKHDYNTIVLACGAAAVAAAKVVERGPSGGITGFQAGGVMWEFIQRWGLYPKDTPLKITNYNDLFFPQMRYKFTTIGKETWDWAQKEAVKNLGKRGHAAESVVSHWESIASGKIPFGLTIEE